MMARVHQFDWASTSLGAMRNWPSNLKTAVDICLNSRFPMVIWWGKDLTLIYNDAWRPIIGNKHPGALGRRGHTVFPEIWDIIGPMHEGVLADGRATWSDDQLLLMKRRAYLDLEEAYFTWSYSAILNKDGRVGGVFTAVSETTDRVLSERRLETLRKLSARAAESRTVKEACEGAGNALEENDFDIAFALIYLLGQDRGAARLMKSVRVAPGATVAPESIELGAFSCPWPVAEAVATGAPIHVADLQARFGELPGGRWPSAPREAVILPLTFAGQNRPGGVAIVGLSAYLQPGKSYSSFLELAVGHMATGISNAIAYESERRRAEALAELDRAKTTFFSNVSHEFRTPLTLMLGPLEDLLQSSASVVETPREQLEIVHRNGLRLLRLVNSLLDFSRIESGRIQPSLQQVDLAALTADLASVFRAAIEKAGLALVVECSPDSIAAFADRDMWEKIVLNLVSNAFKFTLAGTVAVRIRAVDGTAELVVEDTGVGIPEAELPHVFERFHRVTGALARSHEGTGIGLALVHELVKLHGGSIQVNSTEGKGTRFAVSIPLGNPSGQAPIPSPLRSSRHLTLHHEIYVEEAARWTIGEAPVRKYGSTRPSHAQSEGRVLVVDDSADMRDYLRSLLQDSFEVLTVENGEEALRALVQGPLPDVVLTDVMMPVMDGFELLRRVREDERTRVLPIVMLSARAGEEAKVEGLQAGADDYLVKPFTARELTARVRSQISLTRIRRSSELAIRGAEEQLRLAIEASDLGIWELNPRTGVLQSNARYRDMFGFAADAEITMESALEKVLGEDREALRKSVDSFANDEPGTDYQFSYRVMHGDGSIRSLSAKGKAIGLRGDELNPFRIVGTVQDLTEQKRVEESLREVQKLESLGLLAGGIAHDFNNLLTGVMGNASLLAEEVAAGSQELEIVRSVMDAAERMSRLTSQMLAYSGRGRFVIDSLDLSKQVLQITSLIHASVPSNVQLRLALANNLPLIDADSGQLQQVIMNLVINAAEAVGNGAGSVDIATGVEAVTEKTLQANVSRQAAETGDYVVLRVSDTGCGMDKATRARIFDPFFTTKFTGRGLGLASVLGIIRGHNGLMTVESEPGKGTSFNAFFPISERRVATQATAAQSRPGAGRVLVVDDEQIIRDLAEVALRKLGYTVVLAANGKEAVDIVLREPMSIDIVLLDMIMPLLGGEETLDELLKIRPGLVVIAMSGYSEIEAKSRFGGGISGFLQKPFTVGALSLEIGAKAPAQ